jgi:UDP-N-acetylmuramoyl-tripeptide--D-alanyl-D-alanine ligase
VAATGGTANADFECTGVAFDSREIGPGDLFFAMKGEQADGHRFVAQGLCKRSERCGGQPPVDGPHILVPDTMRALEQLGMASRHGSMPRSLVLRARQERPAPRRRLFAALERFAGRARRIVRSKAITTMSAFR